MKRKNLISEENKKTSQKAKPTTIDFDSYIFDESTDLSNINNSKKIGLTNSHNLLKQNGKINFYFQNKIQ